jgi:hypothetical protein
MRQPISQNRKRRDDMSNFFVREMSRLVTSRLFSAHHHSDAKYLTVDLLALEEMTRALANLFGLTLQVSCRR